MRKFNDISPENLHLFLKEFEWRFNNSDLKVQLKKQLNQWVGYLGQPQF
jgi:transposase-like protein